MFVHGHRVLAATRAAHENPISTSWHAKRDTRAWITADGYAGLIWLWPLDISLPPPALCTKCHSGDTHLCRSASTGGLKAQTEKCQSTGLLSTQLLCIISPSCPRAFHIHAKEARLAIKSTGLWDCYKPKNSFFFLPTKSCGQGRPGLCFLLKATSQSWRSPHAGPTSPCRAKTPCGFIAVLCSHQSFPLKASFPITAIYQSQNKVTITDY